jgi:hypothetical protein
MKLFLPKSRREIEVHPDSESITSGFEYLSTFNRSFRHLCALRPVVGRLPSRLPDAASTVK